MNSACNRAAVLPTCANSYSSFKPACLDPSIPWLKLEESCSGVQDLYNGAVLQPQHASDGSIYGANVMYAASEVNSPVRPPATPLRLDASSNQLLAAALDGDFGSQCHPSGLKYPVCAENYGVTCSSADALKPFSALDDLLGVCGRNVDYNHDLSVFQRLFAGNNVSSCSSKEMVVRGQAAGALSHILCTGEAKIRTLRSPNLGEEGSECCNLSSHEQMHQLGAQIQLQADAMQIGDNKDPAICFANPKTPSSGDSQAPSPGTPSSTRIMLSPQILATSGVYNCGNATDLKQPNSLNVNLPARDGISSMKAMIYRAAALQPIGALIADLGSKPKRKNMKISKDPQSIAARHRRERISNKIRILQRLVPGGTKMDTASMLDEAIQYVKFLKSQVKAMESLGFSADPIFAQASASPSSSIDQCGV